MQTREHIVWGIKFGLYLAGVCSAFVSVMALVHGSTAYVRPGLSVWRMIGLYLVTGALGGLLIGVLREFATTKASSVIVGMITGVFAYSALGLGLQDLVEFSLPLTVLIGVTVGGFLGYALSAKA